MANILVIDDSRSVAAFVAHSLREAGHEVTEAASGSKGARLIASRNFDLVVTDIYMPDTDGLELIMRLRLRHAPPRVIAMSSNDGPVDVLGVARRMGACRCLKKPFDQRQLLDAVSCALEGVHVEATLT